MKLGIFSRVSTTVTHDNLISLDTIALGSKVHTSHISYNYWPRGYLQSQFKKSIKEQQKKWKFICIILIKLDKREKYMLEKIVLPSILLAINGNAK